jgi:hypothetical protein
MCLLVPAYVGIELADMFSWLNSASFNSIKHMAPKDTVIEDQVNEVMFVTDQNSLLASFESKNHGRAQAGIPQFC